MRHLGTVIVGAAASKNNTNTTGTPFLVPVGAQIVYVRTTATDVHYHSGPEAAALSAPSTTAATATDFPLVSGQAFPENVQSFMNAPQFGVVNTTMVFAFYSAGGAEVSLYTTAA